ncbi:abaecin-like [Pseudomyrmex gracilis]|uniref:abaecin-like n=1 Tax=Pseudomyrmex gracilis TaxID=219809 RepID=UPI000994E087|nr:abaecin-like [Pseudomyrmex gracilis]
MVHKTRTHHSRGLPRFKNNTHIVNMKFAIYAVMLLVAICALFANTQALPGRRSSLPCGPGYGPFNPRKSWPIPLPKHG